MITRILLAFCLLSPGLLLSLPLAFDPVPALADQPSRAALPMPGKTTLYQRVITKPAGVMRKEPRADGDVVEAKVPTFSVFYIYAERDGFVELGSNSHGETKGWMARDSVVDWKQSIVVAFNNRADAGRDRQSFYADKAQLEHALSSGGRSAEGVIAREPENAIDIAQNFYLLPILGHESTYLPGDSEGNLLEVASVTEDTENRDDRDFKAAVVFVIDTTVSMDPYIEQTKQAVQQISQTLENSDLAGKFSFGLVGFRQSERTNPGIGYHVRNFLPLSSHSGAAEFITKIDQMKVASRPTEGFDEDSIGGIDLAIKDNDWRDFKARYLILITDAGPRSPELGDNYAQMLSVGELAGNLRANKIRAQILHLKTPAGASDHASAEAKYREVSAMDGSAYARYTSVRNGDLHAFRSEIDVVASEILGTSRDIAANREITEPEAQDVSTSANIRRAARAFQLEYVGSREGESAPPFYRAWTVDRAFNDFRRQALDVRILLTKNQLSTMTENLREIVERANRPGELLDANRFFQDIQDLALRTSNDPTQLNENRTLGNAIAEYLDDLPYKSQTTALTMQDWVSAGATEQRDIMHALNSKLEFYERVHNNPDLWFALHEDAAPGEYVTTMSLDRMP
ncbi:MULTISPECIES: vWA domain-containing protein [Rhizobium]|uniref:VWA domain-containing protein n=1 Tax=Rhizobium aouanii TaxID=3118145 RepID=A0ABU8CWE9_9HYPH|nr:vWA domain-containing protein [Rhizobium acaciae]MCW1754163.1 VWA domain-containing protein [Rhizobium acaciae]